MLVTRQFQRGVMSMPKLEETKKPSERIAKAKRLRALAKGYKALKKDNGRAYQAAAEALELVEERTDNDRAAIRERLREPELIRE